MSELGFKGELGVQRKIRVFKASSPSRLLFSMAGPDHPVVSAGVSLTSPGSFMCSSSPSCRVKGTLLYSSQG